MSHSLRLLLGAALVGLAGSALATDVGVSVQISQPGVYGRIDIGRYPQPVLVAPQPVVIQRPVVVAAPQPVYMWVPPGHRKHWSKHCGKYNACGVPVYFVQDGWYQKNVMSPPPGRGPGGEHGPGHGKGQGHGHGNGHGKRD